MTGSYSSSLETPKEFSRVITRGVEHSVDTNVAYLLPYLKQIAMSYLLHPNRLAHPCILLLSRLNLLSAGLTKRENVIPAE